MGAQTWVFAECDGPLPDGQPIDSQVQHQGVPEGEHSVTIEARLPGVERVLRSDTVEVTLACGEPAAEPEPRPTAEPASPPHGDDGDDGDDPPAAASGDRAIDAAGSAGAGADSGSAGAGEDDEARGGRTYVDTMPEHDRNCAAVAPVGAHGSRSAFAGVLLALLALVLRGRLAIHVRSARRARLPGRGSSRSR